MDVYYVHYDIRRRTGQNKKFNTLYSKFYSFYLLY